MQIGIIGLGRMGGFLAEHFAANNKVLLYDINEERKNDFAKRINALPAETLASMAAARLIIMALSSETLPKAAAELASVLTSKHILINIATTLPRKEVEKVVSPEVKVVSTKMVGHAQEMRRGARPFVVVDGSDKSAVQDVAELFKSLGNVVEAPEELVSRLNSLAAAEGVRAALRIKQIMEEEKLPMQWWETAVSLVAAGTMKAFAAGDAGPFVQKLIAEMKNN